MIIIIENVWVTLEIAGVHLELNQYGKGYFLNRENREGFFGKEHRERGRVL